MRAVGERYSPGEVNFIRSNYLTMSSRMLGAHLDRSVGSIDDKIGKLGLRRFRTVAFTTKEDAVIRSGFSSRSSIDIGKELGRGPSVIRMRARRLGLGSWQKPYKDLQGQYKVTRVDRLENGRYRRVPEHRVIMEEYLGRRLSSDERVHHINCSKRDNRVENLHLCSSTAAHSQAHHSIDALIPSLLERGIVEFDRVRGIYRLCAIHK